jgi:hypothetical protein
MDCQSMAFVLGTWLFGGKLSSIAPNSALVVLEYGWRSKIEFGVSRHTSLGGAPHDSGWHSA